MCSCCTRTSINYSHQSMLKEKKSLNKILGLFVAGIFSASLSSLSTSFNSMAAIVLEDYYKPFANQPLSEKQTSYLMRSTVFGVGIISLALVFVVAKLDATVLELSMKLGGVTLGATFGIFTMGLMCPWVNKRVRLFFLFLYNSHNG